MGWQTQRTPASSENEEVFISLWSRGDSVLELVFGAVAATIIVVVVYALVKVVVWRTSGFLMPPLFELLSALWPF